MALMPPLFQDHFSCSMSVNGNVCASLVDNDLDGFNTSTDCNDNNASIYPGATEVCNTIDDDCDTMIDEGVQSVFMLTTMATNMVIPLMKF